MDLQKTPILKFDCVICISFLLKFHKIQITRSYHWVLSHKYLRKFQNCDFAFIYRNVSFWHVRLVVSFASFFEQQYHGVISILFEITLLCAKICLVSKKCWLKEVLRRPFTDRSMNMSIKNSFMKVFNLYHIK